MKKKRAEELAESRGRREKLKQRLRLRRGPRDRRKRNSMLQAERKLRNAKILKYCKILRVWSCRGCGAGVGCLCVARAAEACAGASVV
jgi:hypothetical protein